MKKKVISVLLTTAMIASLLAGCTGNASTSAPAEGQESTEASTGAVEQIEEAAPAEEELDYQFGQGVTFHSDEPVNYSMFFSDASWYPMVETWETEGVFAKIKEMTNVTLDLTSIDSGDYDNKVSLMINAGDAPYIIPKTYNDAPYVDGGAVVAVSDYVQYMPNYTNFYNTYNMKADVDTIVRSDGKYYRLPGMLESPIQDYTFLLRNDYFKGAGYDVSTLEKDWTWDDFYDILVDVKAYMVSEGIVKESDYIWSDLWCGSEIADGSGGNLLKLMGASYGVRAGWDMDNGMEFNAETGEWYFTPTTDEYKEYVSMITKFVNGGILDPETFTQDNQTANNKFWRGETALMSMNRGQYAGWITGLNDTLGEGNYETYICVIPKGTNNYMAENARIENGVMLSQKALDELGEDGFIKMCRFIDWLFYSDEAYDLIKWGVEGETYEVVDGQKQLMDGMCCSGLGIASTAESDVDIRLQWGYAGGNFWYGGTVDQMTDNFIPEIMDFVDREIAYREIKPLRPALVTNEEENEQINLWKTPLIDNVNTWTLQFASGVKNVETDWDEYVASCEALNSKQMTDYINEIYSKQK